MTDLTAAPSGARDFDYLYGHWRIANRRLKQRLQGCTEWEEFEATGHARPLPGGIGNYDDFLAPVWRPGFVGMSLRVYNPGTRLWSIYWLENQSGGLDNAGQLLPPVVGSFEDGVGTFEGEDELEGKLIRVRYTWSDIDGASARWQQTMSSDGGLNWETNWIMDMTKVEA
jgi:hypothetical protein